MSVYDANFDVPLGWADPNKRTSEGDQYNKMVGIHVGYGDSGAWGSGWSGFVEGTDLPSTPTQFKWCFRFNTDNSELRLYCHDGTNWRYTLFT